MENGEFFIAVAEAANAVYQGHKVETGYVEDGYLGGSLATEKALADALLPLTKDTEMDIEMDIERGNNTQK